MRELIPEKNIRLRIAEMAQEIDEAYAGRIPLVVGVMKGSLHFLSDLTREMKIEQRLDFLRVSTYPDGFSPEPEPHVEAWEDFDAKGKNVLVVDDILDQGSTANAIAEFLAKEHPKSVTWVVLVVKEGAVERSGIDPDFVGFEIPNVWVVGYGMDLGERYRNLDGIYEVGSD